MKNLSTCQPSLSLKHIAQSVSCLFLLASLLSVAFGQQKPQRGLYPTGTFQPSDVDIIDTASGNLSMRFPLGSLPPGRGEVSAGIGIFYSSKPFDLSRSNGIPDGDGNLLSADILIQSPQAGWQYGYEYKLQLLRRPNFVDYAPCPGNQPSHELKYSYKVVITYPDGSDHEFRPWGNNLIAGLGDGYYGVTPAGELHDPCSNPSLIHSYTSMTYYSTDGTFTRLEINSSNPENVNNLPWVLYLPNGGKVTHQESIAGGGTAYQRIYDRNGHWVEIKNVMLNGHEAIKIVDELNREVVLEYNGGGNLIDTITSPAPNNQTIVWKVKRRNVSPTAHYFTPASDGETNFSTQIPSSPGIEQIIAPTQTGGLIYSFTYNSDNGGNGGGEIKEMTLPSSAKVTYTFNYLCTEFSCYPSPRPLEVLQSFVTLKQKTYDETYDGNTTTVNEQWDYTKTRVISGGYTITETKSPDQAVTKQYSFCTDGPCGSSSQFWRAGIVYKVEAPDGSVTERLWQTNTPYNEYEPVFINPFVKTEFTSIKDGNTLTKTAIKDYKYDKNGNVTQVVEYDWVPYLDVQRDSDGRPNGVPASAVIKRVTVNDYYVVTPDALSSSSDSSYFDNEVYHLTSAPKLRTAMKSTEIRSALTSGTQARTEYFYEGATTIGNVTEMRSWDSAKGALTSSLNSGNSVSVKNQYLSWPNGQTGKLDVTIDANGNYSRFTYGDIGNGTSNLYPTTVVTGDNAAGNSPIKRTATSKYDFNSGLVTEATDVDNNVMTKTTYDFFGRPTLVQEAFGKPTEHQTSIQYFDVERFVMTRSDLNMKTDGKLISIQRYDQLGRIRLSQTLESGSITDPNDPTVGIKVQTRYFAGSLSDPNSYTLVSNPYRAATSGGASGEAEMGWTRTKRQNDGRLTEVETFAGNGLPAPWGSNSTSTGKVVTSINAEFTTVTDQTNRSRRSMIDVLGRLVRVDEPDAVSGNLDVNNLPVQPTYYTYDVLGNLTRVRQGGTPTAGSGNVIQTRTFFYNSLSRLLYASNPEQDATIPGPAGSGTRWTMKYEYDDNGNLTKRTDARNVVTNYSYDALNRNTKVCYSDQTPSVHRFYDSSSVSHGKGRLWKVENQTTCTSGTATKSRTTINAYDELGRVTSQTQSFATGTPPNWTDYSIWPEYNLAGQMTKQTYPSGHTVNYTFYNDGKLRFFTGNLGLGASTSYNYVSNDGLVGGTQYNAAGQMTQEYFGTPGNNLYHHVRYNSRLQMTETLLGTGNNPNVGTDAWARGKLVFDYGTTQNNGNVLKQEHFVPTSVTVNRPSSPDAVTQHVIPMRDVYEYDKLNRLTTVTGRQWENGTESNPIYKQTFVYDPFGNRKIDADPAKTFGNDINKKVYEPNKRNNRLNGLIYDAAGNVINESYTFRQYDRKYDAENRMTQANAVNSYVYDGDGRRVRRNVNGAETWQVYGIGGELLAEYKLTNGTPVLDKEYGYRNGQMLIVAEASPASVKWMVTDHLGTPRIIVDATGGVVNGGSLSNVWRHDYLPFGEELTPAMAGNGLRSGGNGYVVDAVRQKFTSYERDDETGLDFAQNRYYSSIQGRFTSFDRLYESAKATMPQSWNRYAYCLNNPLIYIDPSGLLWYIQDSGNQPTWFNEPPTESGWKLYEDFVYDAGDEGWIVLNPHHNDYGYFETENQARTAYGQLVDPGQNISIIESAIEMDLMITGGGILGRLGIGITRKLATREAVSLAERRAAQLAINRAAGEAAEATVKEQLEAEGYIILGSQVGARTSLGLRRIDHLVQTPKGELLAVEVKAGNAARDAAQLAKDAEMAAVGAKIVGKNAPAALRGQTIVIKTVERKVP